MHPESSTPGLRGWEMSPLGKPNRLTKHPSRGFQDIFKRRLLTLCSGLVKCRSFELMFQDLATVDVLRGMKYPLVPFGTPFAYTCVRIRVPKPCGTGIFYIRRGLRVVGSNIKAMRQPHKVEQANAGFTLFLCTYV